MPDTPQQMVVKVNPTHSFGQSPLVARIDLTPEFVARVHELQGTAIRLNVALISEERAPCWDLANDFKIQGQLLVVSRHDFWFSGRPDDENYRVETDAVLISDLDKYLAEGEPVIYHGDQPYDPVDLANIAKLERLLPTEGSGMSRAQVVVIVRGGNVQGIVGDREDVDILIQDFDVENEDHGGTLPRDAQGDEFNAITGPDTVDPEYVAQTFRQVKDVYG